MVYMRDNDSRSRLKDIFSAALDAVDPYSAVVRFGNGVRDRYIRGGYERMLIIAFGKAACPMAMAAQDTLGDLGISGTVITKYSHCLPPHVPDRMRVFEGGHPLPDEGGVRGTDEAIASLRKADERTLVLCLISGGGSALLVSPFGNITLEEKQYVTKLLLLAGADIYELNTVRKHISAVKGGRLAELAHPAGVTSLILSDVMGDNLDVIASGPTAPDSSTYRDAQQVIQKFFLREKLPPSVLEAIEEGARGNIPDTPKKDSPLFSKVENIIIGSNILALEAAKRKAAELGFRAEIFSTEVRGEARDAGKLLAFAALEKKNEKTSAEPVCLISGGETTVTVRGKGIGGRNMEFALGFAEEIKGRDDIMLLSAGTDGTDGPTDAAGAIVDGSTIAKGRGAGLDHETFLANSDSYHYLKEIDDLLITGPTGTNVMDIQIALVE